MAGGDMRVGADAPQLGRVHHDEMIDAHSVRSGDYTEQRTVGGKTVFFTAEGAAAYDALLAQGVSFSASTDPSKLVAWLLGDRARHQGSVE